MDYPAGLDPYTARQHLLHHTYSPLISFQSSYNADVLIQSILNNNDISMLQILKLYGNNAKYSIPNQSYKIINNQLITKTYPSFPVRFEPSLPELLSIINASSNPNQLSQLFSISSLELLLKHRSTECSGNNLYLDLFNKIITSNKIVPFETFNHPISQIFTIDYETDSIEHLRKLIVEFRNFNFPKFFQIDDLLIHVFILFDPNKVANDEIVSLQNKIRANLNIFSTAIPMIQSVDDGFISLSLNENSTIEEDLQRISLKNSSSILQIPKSIDTILRSILYEFINKYLIAHMQSKIRVWDDQILQPKKSITNKFFSASRKLFNNESNLSSSFNYKENYYFKSSPEQKIRKLADWSLILKDFKYSYSTYDLIKKDYANDKAWAYVASTQEMCIVSLLLAQTQQINQAPQPDKNTLRKIRHDIIEPYIDNLSYTFKSRLNLKTYSVKALLVTVELLLCMCQAFNISWWWNDLIEKYLCKCINEFDTHLMTTNQQSQVIRAILYERLGYSFGKCVYLNDEIKNLIKATTESDQEQDKLQDDGYYNNPNKAQVPDNNSILGLTRFRKSSIWYLLSMKEWLILKNYNQVNYLLINIEYIYKVNDLTNEWYDRNDLLLGFIKRCLKEHNDNLDN